MIAVYIDIIGQQLRAEGKTSHASYKFPRPFESQFVAPHDDLKVVMVGGSPWKCVLGHGLWGPLKHGWASGLVLIAVFEAQFFCKLEWKSMPQMLSSEIRKRELYILGPRHQLMVIEREADYHWLFFGLLMCLLGPNSSWHLPSTKAWHDCGSVFEIEVHKNVLIAEKVTICLIERWRCHSLMKHHGGIWRMVSGWFLDVFWTTTNSCQHPDLGHSNIKIIDCSPGLLGEWDQ